MEFNEAHLEEGRGRIEPDEGWRSLSGGSEKGTISEVASRASWGSNEGFWPESYVYGEGDSSVPKEAYTWMDLGSCPKHDRYRKTELTISEKDRKICTRKDKMSWRKAT